jgi:hypothetical protein
MWVWESDKEGLFGESGLLDVKDYPVFVVQYYDLGECKKFQKKAKRLASQCDDYGIPWYIEDVKDDVLAFIDRLSYLNDVTRRRKRTRYMSFFVRRVMEALDRPIFHIHADSSIQRKIPVEFFHGISVGFSRGKTEQKSHPNHLMASPIYFSDDYIGRNFIDLWCFKCQHLDAQHSEHGPIGSTIQDLRKTNRVKEFPEQVSSRLDEDHLYIKHVK